MGKKKKFIDKKNAVTFQLVHRSQRDPLISDDTAPQHVLRPVDEEAKNEMLKYGIFRDDGYDYLQHLKEIDSNDVEMVQQEYAKRERVPKQAHKLNLPSSVFGSTVENKIGLLNKAAPKGLVVGYDEDLLEVYGELEDGKEFDDEDELDDDFMQMAGEVIPDDEEGDKEYGSDFDFDEDEEISDDEMRDRVMEMEETKTRFTDYSMSSSVIRRNEHLANLDDRFEEMFSQYDEEEIGALDTEEIEGDIEPQPSVLNQMADEFEKESQPVIDTEKYKFIYDESSGNESDCSLIEIEEKEKWDCESILSTYSNLYNHPKIIGAPPSNKIRINPKTGIPITSNRLTTSALAKHDGEPKGKATGPGSLVSIVSTLSIRPKGETPPERLSRKKAYKVYKKERRTERKLNTEAFKEEKKRLEKVMANNKTRHQIPI